MGHPRRDGPSCVPGPRHLVGDLDCLLRVDECGTKYFDLLRCLDHPDLINETATIDESAFGQEGLELLVVLRQQIVLLNPDSGGRETFLAKDFGQGRHWSALELPIYANILDPGLLKHPTELPAPNHDGRLSVARPYNRADALLDVPLDLKRGTREIAKVLERHTHNGIEVACLQERLHATHVHEWLCVHPSTPSSRENSLTR